MQIQQTQKKRRVRRRVESNQQAGVSGLFSLIDSRHPAQAAAASLQHPVSEKLTLATRHECNDPSGCSEKCLPRPLVVPHGSVSRPDSGRRQIRLNQCAQPPENVADKAGSSSFAQGPKGHRNAQRVAARHGTALGTTTVMVRSRGSRRDGQSNRTKKNAGQSDLLPLNIMDSQPADGNNTSLPTRKRVEGRKRDGRIQGKERRRKRPGSHEHRKINKEMDENIPFCSR